jgi:hypothetical protein
LDDTGYPVIPDEEIMLIFGGLTFRWKTFNDNTTLIFDDCEDYDTIEGTSELPDYLKDCGEELLNDIWRYHVTRNVWSYVKLDYDRITASGI